MTGRRTSTAERPELEPELLQRTRIEVIAAVLPVKIWLNPSWALVAIVPFVGLFPAFGTVAAGRLAFTIIVHLANSLLAAAFYVRYRRDPSDGKAWLNIFTLFQALVGLSWGLMAWLLWVPGNALNHAMIVLPIVAVLWSNSAARTTYWSIYVAGVVPIYSLTLIRLLSSRDPAAVGLSVVFSLASAYMTMVAVGAKRQTECLLRANLANDNLTAELRGARDDALRKRYEAEAANASKTTFLANMSHELRTPLNAILGFSEIISSESFGPVGVPRYRDYANDIHSSGAHLLSIINDILDIAKIESGKMEIIPDYLDVKSTIDSTLRILTPRLRAKGQNLLLRIAEDASTVFVDERAFKQILMNLVGNAVKFTQSGGVITVHGCRTDDGGFELIVEDDGPGIEPSALEHIFTPFNQVDNRYNRQEGGTGLGLSLVRGLAVLHGGKAWIETEVGTGVKAHVYFPAGNLAAISEPDAQLTA